MAGANPPHTNPDKSLAEGSEATHIGPETGDTARGTMQEGSSAGTHGASPSPAEGSGIGNTTRPVEKLDQEGRSFQGGGQEGGSGGASQGGGEALKDVADGKSGH